MHGFVTSYFGLSEDADPLSDAHHPHVDIVHFKILKPTFVEIPTNLIRKVSKYWDTVKPKRIEKSLSNYQFLLEKSNLIIGCKRCHLFFRLTVFIFEKVSAKFPSLHKYCLSSNCYFKQKWVLSRPVSNSVTKCLFSLICNRYVYYSLIFFTQDVYLIWRIY